MLRVITALLPIVPWVVFRALDKNDFTPYSCAIVNIGCPRTPPINGYVSPDFSKVQQIFQDNIASGDDVGASVAVYVDGDLKIELYGGYSDRELRKPYTNETLQIVFSCTKAMVS